MGQWLSCAAVSTPGSVASSSSTSNAPATTKHVSLQPSAAAINRRAATSTESTLVDSATSHSVTAFPLSTTNSFASSHLSVSPPHHRRYLSAPSSLPYSAFAPSSPPPTVPTPPPQLTYMRSSSASSCSSTCGLVSDSAAVEACPGVLARTSSHVDDIIEEAVEQSSPSSAAITPPRSTTRPSIERQMEEAAEESVADARCALLTPPHATRVLSPRSVLAFMIVSNGGECETADESSWEDEVEEVSDESDDESTLSMRDILASLPTSSTTFISPFPSSTLQSYPSAPSLLPSASSLRPSMRYSTASLSYPSLAVLARQTSRLQQQQQQQEPQASAAESSSEESESSESGAELGEKERAGACGRQLYVERSLAMSTSSITA